MSSKAQMTRFGRSDVGWMLRGIDTSILSQAEEVRFIKRARHGDRKAAEQLVHHNLKFVISVALGYQGLGLELADLVQEGAIGVQFAAERFDETRGFRFISYAVWWIRQRMLIALVEQSTTIRGTQEMVSLKRKLTETKKYLAQIHSRIPTSQEIAEASGVSESAVSEASSLLLDTISLDAAVGSSDDTTLHESLADGRTFSAEAKHRRGQLRKQLEADMSALPEREQLALRLHLGWDGSHAYSREELAQYFNITGEQARQLVQMAIRRLRVALSPEKLNHLRLFAGNALSRDA